MRRLDEDLTWWLQEDWTTTNCPGQAKLNIKPNCCFCSKYKVTFFYNGVKENISLAPLCSGLFLGDTLYRSCIAVQGPAFLIILDISYVAIFFFDI